MNIQNWKIFDKSGSPLTLYEDTYLPLTFVADNLDATGAAAFAITDPSNYIIGVKVTDSGWEYPGNTEVQLNYSFSLDTNTYPKTLNPSEVSIGFKDVSIFSPGPSNSPAIESVTITLPDPSFLYPSVSFSSAIFLNPISQGLVETEHLTILEEASVGVYIKPYDPVNPYLIFRFTDGDPEIKLFDIDEDGQTVEWSDEIIFDASEYSPGNAIMLNIGFRSENEGVYERRLRIFHLVGNREYLLGEIMVNAESIGQDERFDTLITNFGLPSPKANFSLFKEADINEALPDWELVNYKAKHLILEHDKIMPFIGTYKGLINAIKWLGYDDIYFKEWFKNAKDGTKLSLTVPYNAADRTKTLLYFSPEERRNLKKLNQLSLCYCITRDTGEVDEWGNPITEDCYNYNLNEILIKLYSLKQWLERWIIGVNARIIDLTGEGVYFERFRSLIYANEHISTEATFEQSLSPMVLTPDSELVMGDSSLSLTFEEFKKTKVSDLPIRFKDLISYCWNPSDGYFSYDPSTIASHDPSTVFVGSPFQFPLSGFFDVQWKASIENSFSGVVTDNLVTKALHVYENDLRFYNVLDSSSQFYDVSTNLNILLENAYLRDANNDVWLDSEAYHIYPDPSGNGFYWIESSSGLDIYRSSGYVNLKPSTGSILLYEFDSNYRVPLLSMQNYYFQDISGNIINFNQKYFLDILDGKIAMDSSIMGIKDWVVDPTIPNIIDVENYINWNYDTSLDEQKITFNKIYRSPRMPIVIYDPSAYYNLGPSFARVVDNSVYNMPVNHIGDYYLEAYAWDGYNNIYFSQMENTYSVWTKFPRIYSLVDSSNYLHKEASTFMILDEVSTLISKNKYPLYDRYIPLQGLTLKMDGSGNPYLEIPSITYFQDVMEPDSLNRFFNLTERVISISSPNIEIDPDFQKFYINDDIQLIKFDRGKYSFVLEASSRIIGVSGNTLTLDQVPAGMVIDSSTEMYLLNNTYRAVENPVNAGPYFTVDISGYQFEVDQLVGIIVTHNTNGYSWGSSYRVLSVDGSTHTFDQTIPQFFLNPSLYKIEAKHAFSTYSDFTIETDHAVEVANKFNLYLKNSHCQEYFLDNTFVVINILFDQDYVNQQWYDVSDNLVNSTFYYYNEPITVDTSTLVIFKSVFDPSNYMLDQHNIWTVKNHDPEQMIFRVFNESVPFIFNRNGTYDVQVESFDKYGNLKTQVWEGLIKVQ